MARPNYHPGIDCDIAAAARRIPADKAGWLLIAGGDRR